MKSARLRELSLPERVRYVYLFLAAFIFVANFILGFHHILANRTLLWILVGFTVVLALCTYEVEAEFLYIVCYLAVAFTPFRDELNFPVFGVYLICVLWFMRGRIAWPLLTLVAVEALHLHFSSHLVTQLVSSFALFVVVTAMGMSLLFFNRRVASYACQLEQAEAARDAIRKDLAAQLHDTLAKDLTQISILAQDLALQNPHLNPQLGELVEASRNASRRLRPLIMDADMSSRNQNITTTIDTATTMLKGRQITLHSELGPGVTDINDMEGLHLATLFIRETATNALKYAPSTSDVYLLAELNNQGLTLTMSNKIAHQNVASALTGGFGLTNLKERIETHGGSFSFRSSADEWVVIAIIKLVSERSNHAQ